MRKYRSAYLKPYIRRKTEKDVNYPRCDFRTCVRLCLPYFKYVAVQRGTNHIIGCGRNRKELKEEMLENENVESFKVWANKIKIWQQDITLKIKRKGL
jgi:hypothetical protein